MKRTSLGFLLVLNAALLGGIYLVAAPAPAAHAQFAASGARYTMIASLTDGRSDEATIYLIDTQSGATVPLRYTDSRNRIRLSEGRVISDDAAAVLEERGADRDHR